MQTTLTQLVYNIGSTLAHLVRVLQCLNHTTDTKIMLAAANPNTPLHCNCVIYECLTLLLYQCRALGFNYLGKRHKRVTQRIELLDYLLSILNKYSFSRQLASN